jgi:hypothetical protein
MQREDTTRSKPNPHRRLGGAGSANLKRAWVWAGHGLRECTGARSSEILDALDEIDVKFNTLLAGAYRAIVRSGEAPDLE